MTLNVPGTYDGKVALAFSGGLDTTAGVPLLTEEYGFDEVIGVTVDVGQPEHELESAAETAELLDVEHFVVDAKAEFANLCLQSVRANANYQGYPLGTALARPVIATAIQEVAEEQGCSALAHGCTGKGNDQLRFEAIWRDSELEVVAPVRDLGLTREFEKEYAESHGLPVEAGNEGAWSIDTNLWSRSVEGDDLEDPGYVPPEDIYEWTDAPGGVDTETVTIGFENGYATSLDGEEMEPVALIETLNEQAGRHGIGRTDMMEDRMLGLKVRENYEHPAATVLLAAHKALEGLVLTQEERSTKEGIDQQWSEKAYQGLLMAPIVEALDGFIEATQKRVTGTVTLKLEGGSARPVARESAYAVYSESAASFNTETVEGIAQQDAIGVAKYHGFQDRLANRVIKAADAAEDVGESQTTEAITDGGGTADAGADGGADAGADAGADGTDDEEEADGWTASVTATDSQLTEE